MWKLRHWACLALFCASHTAVVADDPRAQVAERRSENNVDGGKAKPLTTFLNLQDGAASADEALRAYVAASNQADDNAVLKLIDPPLRKLLRPEMAIERFAIHERQLKHSLLRQDMALATGMLFQFAWRDLTNLKQAEILETRAVDDDRVVFTIYSSESSYHHAGDTTTVQEILTTRRSERWYISKPFGLLTNYLRGDDDETDNSKRPILQIKTGTAEKSNRRDAEFECQFNLPVELVFQELSACAESPEIAECLALAEELERLFNVIEKQSIRGDFRTLVQLEQSLANANVLQEELSSKVSLAIEPAVKRLNQMHHDYVSSRSHR